MRKRTVFPEADGRRMATLGRADPGGGCVGAMDGVVVPVEGVEGRAEEGAFTTLVGVSIIFCLTKI